MIYRLYFDDRPPLDATARSEMLLLLAVEGPFCRRVRLRVCYRAPRGLRALALTPPISSATLIAIPTGGRYATPDVAPTR